MELNEQKKEPENPALKKDDTTTANAAGNLQMDYSDLATETAQSSEKAPTVPIGLAGGQARDDDRGQDMSQYTGPQSKYSSNLDDPEAPYGTGPGNGLSDGNSSSGADWENPEPENDSF